MKQKTEPTGSFSRRRQVLLIVEDLQRTLLMEMKSVNPRMHPIKPETKDRWARQLEEALASIHQLAGDREVG